MFGPGLPPRLPRTRLAVDLELDDELVDLKLAALRAQATQIAPLLDAFGEDRYREWVRDEYFVAPVL